MTPSRSAATTPVDRPEAGALVEALGRQVERYRELLELAEQQPRAIERGDNETLVRLLSERRRIIGELARINAQIDPFTRDWAAFAAGLLADERGQVSLLTAEIGRLRDAIAGRDEADSRALAAQRDRVQREINGVQQVGAAVAAYRGVTAGPAARAYKGLGVGPVSDGGRFTDQRG
jgi:hypothetical protein